VERLQRSGKSFEFPVEWGRDLQSEHERWLAEEHVRRPVIVTDYPMGIKAFYMYRNDDGRTVRAMDVLVPKLGEIIGGSQREHREGVLRERLREAGLAEDRYAWYLDLRRHGSVPHAGFGFALRARIQQRWIGRTNSHRSLEVENRARQVVLEIESDTESGLHLVLVRIGLFEWQEQVERPARLSLLDEKPGQPPLRRRELGVVRGGRDLQLESRILVTFEGEKLFAHRQGDSARLARVEAPAIRPGTNDGRPRRNLAAERHQLALLEFG
jgi:hypothetical protein